jgi:hypothetical protein
MWNFVIVAVNFRASQLRITVELLKTSCTLYTRVSQPGFRGTIGFREMSLRVPRDVAKGSARGLLG